MACMFIIVFLRTSSWNGRVIVSNKSCCTVTLIAVNYQYLPEAPTPTAFPSLLSRAVQL